jgi:hypothetical protein
MMKVGDILIWKAVGPGAQVRVIHTNPTLTYVEVLTGPRLVGERFHLMTNAAEQMAHADASSEMPDGRADARPLPA